MIIIKPHYIGDCRTFFNKPKLFNIIKHINYDSFRIFYFNEYLQYLIISDGFRGKNYEN